METQVLLLCAGRSTRMWPLADKIFFEYLGKTVLEHQLKVLISAGFRRIHLVGNALNLSALQEVVTEKFPEPDLHFSFSVQEQLETGMLGGVLSAEGEVDFAKPLLIMSANDVVEKSFFIDLFSKSKTSDASILICGKKVESYFPGGYLVIDSEHLVREIREKPGTGNEPSDLINLVLHFFRQPSDFLYCLQEELVRNPSGHYGYEACLQKLFDSGVKAEIVPYEGFWQALKYPWHHLALMHHFLDSIEDQAIDSSAQIASSAMISGPVIIAAGVKIFDYAVIQGPAYIGPNSIIGNHVLVRHSHLGPNCMIGHSTEVARSYLREQVWTHQNYVGDSVIDRNVSFGAGTRTANLRLDEGEISSIIQGEKIPSGTKKLGLICGQNVRCGVNTTLLPGIKIGPRTFLGAGITIGEDIPENQFVTGEFSLRKRENKVSVKERDILS